MKIIHYEIMINNLKIDFLFGLFLRPILSLQALVDCNAWLHRHPILEFPACCERTWTGTGFSIYSIFNDRGIQTFSFRKKSTLICSNQESDELRERYAVRFANDHVWAADGKNLLIKDIRITASASGAHPRVNNYEFMGTTL